MRMVKAVEKYPIVITDYGGVLGDHHQDPAELMLASILGVDRDVCRSLLTERSEQGAAFREDRISEEIFWARVYELAGKERRDGPPDVTLSRLWAETYKLNQRVLWVLERLRARARLGVLSNIDPARSGYLVNIVGLLAHIDIYLPSYQFGAIKPKEALWRAADARVRSCFGHDVKVLYIDDRPEHVSACRQVGWEGVRYRGVASLVAELSTRQLISHDLLMPPDDGDAR